MEGPVRILMLFTIMNRGGAETMVMNYYHHIDRKRVQFDFMVHRQEQGVYDDEIKHNGWQDLPYDPPPSIHLRYIQETNFRLSRSTSGVSDYPWALFGIGIFRLSGSSTTSGAGNYCACTQRTCFIRYQMALPHLFRTLLPCRLYLTQGFTCGKEAARWLLGNELGKKAILQRNAIDTLLYRFDEVVRLEVRQELHLPEDATVVGHVGRFNRQKNHEFLLEVFHKYVQELNSTAHLLLVGTGKLQKVIQKKIQQFRLTDQVHLLGETSRM